MCGAVRERGEESLVSSAGLVWLTNVTMPSFSVKFDGSAFILGPGDHLHGGDEP